MLRAGLPGLCLEFSAPEVTRTKAFLELHGCVRLSLCVLTAMWKKPFSFPTVPTPPSPPPNSPTSPSSPGFPYCLWEAPTPPAPPPRKTKFPSLNRRAHPHLGVGKAGGLHTIPEVPSSPRPNNPSSLPAVHPFLQDCVSILQSADALKPPSGLSLASGHPRRRFPGPCIPPAQAPAPTISPLWGPPENCPRCQASQLMETQTSRSLVNRAPAGRNRLAGRYR